SKRIMELFLMKYSKFIDISTARFANVAFSQGSLLDGFTKRIEKRQPLAAPIDVRRYFMTPKESGILCLMSTVLGENKEIFFPKLSEELHMIKFSDIAIRFLELLGYEPYICSTEEEARKLSKELPEKGKWPCYFFESDTTGEKEYEEFYTENEVVKLDKFIDIGIIKYSMEVEESKLKYFLQKVNHFKENYWTKKDLVDLFKYLLPNFLHKETGKYLDQKM
ncbi:nucleoside-diphosphate sugar epimerase, partial [Thermosipho africanus H17ap60334]|uniref:polysaccharide biosynthesis protein n=1 Tax=Thermosipho africanus TaxID=2421 RepID=UPI00028F0663